MSQMGTINSKLSQAISNSAKATQDASKMAGIAEQQIKQSNVMLARVARKADALSWAYCRVTATDRCSGVCTRSRVYQDAGWQYPEADAGNTDGRPVVKNRLNSKQGKTEYSSKRNFTSTTTNSYTSSKTTTVPVKPKCGATNTSGQIARFYRNAPHSPRAYEKYKQCQVAPHNYLRGH